MSSDEVSWAVTEQMRRLAERLGVDIRGMRFDEVISAIGHAAPTDELLLWASELEITPSSSATYEQVWREIVRVRDHYTFVVRKRLRLNTPIEWRGQRYMVVRVGKRRLQVQLFQSQGAGQAMQVRFSGSRIWAEPWELRDARELGPNDFS